MNDSPLASLIARSLRAEVSEVRSEAAPSDEHAHRERVHFMRDGRQETLVFERVPPLESTEVQLLPFLARRSDRVPIVHARGVPPAAAAGWPWLLLEDLLDSPEASAAEAAAVALAKLAVERAVSADSVALRALGVPRRSPSDRLAEVTPPATGAVALGEARAAAERLDAWPAGLVHGDLRTSNAKTTPRGVVLIGWRRAHVGCALLDAARLAADLRARRQDAPARAVEAAYLEGSVGASESALRDAELVDAQLRARER